MLRTLQPRSDNTGHKQQCVQTMSLQVGMLNKAMAAKQRIQNDKERGKAQQHQKKIRSVSKKMKNPFQDEIGMTLKKLMLENSAFYYTRFYDKRSFHKLSPFTPRQPADYLAVYDGAVWFLECKSCHESSFPFKNVQEHQQLGLERASAAGTRALFLICDRRRRNHFRVYAISAAKMGKLMSSGGRKSVRWDVLELACDAIVPRSGELWDLRELFGIKETRDLNDLPKVGE